MKLPKINIPWWQDGSTISEALREPHYLTQGVYAFMQKVQQWLQWPLEQFDPLTCTETLLNLMAWDRDIQRFDGEPLELYRKRVKFAAINAKDSGSVAGFKAIFERLDIGIVAFKEREDPDLWDVITIEVRDSAMSQNSRLMQTLIEQYGRTCRRYRFEVSYPVIVNLHHGEFSHSHALYRARDEYTQTVAVNPSQMNHSQDIFVASIGNNP
ncbi:phage tail protein [Photobacterium sp. 1_MG-2023]|uniref:phage tail protein n=1 Tax=Photobacterium sp. 1_MG-2023 TaxID=3062646 RepID=UPI0026E29653|nr:phage tail protein [Photobacterium sp. 1_MG-2023]MDO6706137.1 phage tail protein [Photobacterium sp. 1_MG-2023]